MAHLRTTAILILLALVSALPAWSQGTNNPVSVPPCFIEDTVYHAVIDLNTKSITFMYGQYPLVSCRFVEIGDASAGFAERWQSRPTPWQVISSRNVLKGHPAISDTVVEVVSRVANVDPDLIRRIQPERFSVDLTGDFRLMVRVADSTEVDRSFGEIVESASRWVLSFGRAATLDLIVSAEDAQTIYYALEPGAPVLMISLSQDNSTAQR